MKLNLSTRFMRCMFAKMMSKMIKKKYGYKVNIHIGEIQMDMFNGNTHVHLNVDVDMGSEEFKKLLSELAED